MSHFQVASLTVFSLILMGLGFSPTARADEWNKETLITFRAPVEIPGKVLAPGTYTFKLMDSEADRNVVLVYNEDQTHLYATLLAVPDYRLRPTGNTVVRMQERAADAPQAVGTWFYPGDNYGWEFAYPKVTR